LKRSPARADPEMAWMVSVAETVSARAREGMARAAREEDEGVAMAAVVVWRRRRGRVARAETAETMARTVSGSRASGPRLAVSCVRVCACLWPC
jgi:hypothetical protein